MGVGVRARARAPSCGALARPCANSAIAAAVEEEEVEEVEPVPREEVEEVGVDEAAQSTAPPARTFAVATSGGTGETVFGRAERTSPSGLTLTWKPRRKPIACPTMCQKAFMFVS